MNIDQKALNFHINELRRLDQQIMFLQQRRALVVQKIQYYQSRAVRR